MAAPIGNKHNEKYTLESELPIFQDLLERAQNGDFYCIQEVVMKSPYSKQIFYYICDRFIDLDSIKEDINDCIISVINRKALDNQANSTASIWRMKQLGEKDQQYQDHTSKGEKMQDKTVIKFVRK
tara:strand:- start:252 stop:629 length:378 start_codon:yes stop_codon:yes gene_type:complete